MWKSLAVRRELFCTFDLRIINSISCCCAYLKNKLGFCASWCKKGVTLMVSLCYSLSLGPTMIPTKSKPKQRVTFSHFIV